MVVRNSIGATRNNHANHAKANQIKRVYFTLVNWLFKKIFKADYRFVESLGQLSCPICAVNRITLCFIKDEAICLCGFTSNVTRLFALALINLARGER